MRIRGARKKETSITIALLTFLLFLLPAAYAFPNVINIQGKLTDPQFNFLTGTHNFTFTTYNALTGGTARHSENISLNMTQGLWSHQLGSNNSLSLAFDEDYYIEVRVNGQTMSPRLRLGVAGYAYRANYTDRVDNVSAGGNATGNFFVIRNLTVSNNVLFVDNATARVGILTTSPAQPLDVRGNVNITGVFYLVNNTGSASNGTLYIGRNNTGALQSIIFDTSLEDDDDETTGKFVFSAPLQVPGDSPGVTFYDPSQPTNTSRYKSIIYNISNTTHPITIGSGAIVNGSLTVTGSSPATITFGSGTNARTLQFEQDNQEFTFSGGKIRQDFVNLIRNGGFESFSAGASWAGNEQAVAPDNWAVISGTAYQYAPATYFAGTDIFQGYSSLKLDGANNTGTAKIVQEIHGYRLQPNRNYSVGVWVRAPNATARLNVSGSALSGTFTEQSTTSNNTWVLLKGQFITKANINGTDQVIIEMRMLNGTGGGSTLAYFDAVQLNAGNVLGEYQDTPLTDTGEQTLYGGLRLRRTGFDRGGVLTVDKSVRTRQIEFSPSSDPGWGSVNTTFFNDPRYNWGSAYTQGNVFLELGGGYSIRITSPAANTSELSFRIDNPEGPTLATTPGKTITLLGPANVTGKLNASGGIILHNTKCTAGQVLSTTADGTLACGTDVGVSGITIPANNVTAGTFPSGKFVFTGTATTNALEVNGSVLVVNGTTGNVGIGTTAPTELLHVRGSEAEILVEHTGGNDIKVTTSDGAGYAGILDTANQPLSINPSGNVLLSRASGNVGIGTTAPGERLHVAGNVFVNNTGVATSTAAFNSSDTILQTSSWNGTATTPYNATLRHVATNGTGNLTRLAFFVNGSERASIDSLGNVGIGIIRPLQTLHVIGTFNASGAIIAHNTKCSAGQVLSTTSDGTLQCVTDSGSGGTTLPYSNLTGTILIGYNNLTGTIGGLTLANISNYNYNVLVNQTNITSGITLPSTNITGGLDAGGVTVPAANVTAGTFPGGKFVFTGSATTNALEVNGSVLVVNGTVGRVGIGTGTPLQNLHVVGTANVSGALITHNTKCTAGQVLSTTADGTLQCVTDAGGSTTTLPYENLTSTITITAANVSAGTFPGGKFVYTGTATTNALEVNGSVLVVNGTVGRVGIGTNQPLQVLTVAGTANVTGAFVAHNTKCTSGQVLSTTADGTLQCVTDANSGGTVTSIATGVGLNATTITSSGTIHFNTTFGDARYFTQAGGITIPISNTTGDLGQNRVGGITLPAANVSAGTFPGGAFVFTGTATNLALNVNNTLYVNGTTGRVGIGIAVPNQTLTVIGTANVTGAFIAHNTKCTSGQVLSTTADGTLQCVTDATGGGGGAGWSNTSTVVFNNTASVTVGIGTNSPNATLHVNGSGASSSGLLVSNGTAAVFFVNATSRSVTITLG